MRYLPIILLVFFVSCRTTKTVQTTRVVTDSTVERGLEEHVRMLERELQERSRDSVVKTITEVIFEECDTTRPATVVFNDNGKLASVSGQLRSVKQQLSEEVAERYMMASQVDSLVTLLEHERAVKQIEDFNRKKAVERRYIPWWVWFLIAALAGLLLRAHWPKLLGLFIKKRTI